MSICQDCGIKLTKENRANKDGLAVFCQNCWNKRDLFEPICPTCDTKLTQNPENLFEIRCPVCNIVEIILTPTC